MLKLEDVTTIVDEHVTDGEAKAAIGMALLERNIPETDANAELEQLKADLEAERTGRAADKADFVEKINRFIYGGVKPDEDAQREVFPETENKDAVEEDKSLYEEYLEVK